MESILKIFFLLILFLNIKKNTAQNGLVTVLEDGIQNKLSECTNYITHWLENFNDRNLGQSEIGKMLRYEDLKTKFGTRSRESKSMKKMSMALIPLIFHVGATSTWMLLTSIMAVKSVLIGMTLLVFKIAVSSAKVGSFFTSLKDKHDDHHHDLSWAPHLDHHGHVRSLTDVGSYSALPWSSYAPEANDISAPSYKTIPTHEQYEELEYKTDVKNGPIGHS